MKMIYQDKLVSITENEITFVDYYFPIKKPKVVRLSSVVAITVKKATLMNGKWRIHGTGNFKTWFPKDKQRFRRDRIFFATLKDQWVRIGFTVEHSDQVEAIFNAMGLINS
jgi:hypothetical protein